MLTYHEIKKESPELASIQADNGLEFCIGSKRKEIELNQFLTRFNASFSSIPAGKKCLQGVIERSHRSDDEEFLAIYLSCCNNSYDFIYYAQRWQDTWNAGRPHFGIDMNGLTPLDKLRKSNILCPENLLRFPVLLMEDLLPFSSFLTGQYVLTNYLFLTSYCFFRLPLLVPSTREGREGLGG